MLVENDAIAEARLSALVETGVDKQVTLLHSQAKHSDELTAQLQSDTAMLKAQLAAKSHQLQAAFDRMLYCCAALSLLFMVVTFHLRHAPLGAARATGLWGTAPPGDEGSSASPGSLASRASLSTRRGPGLAYCGPGPPVSTVAPLA